MHTKMHPLLLLRCFFLSGAVDLLGDELNPQLDSFSSGSSSGVGVLNLSSSGVGVLNLSSSGVGVLNLSSSGVAMPNFRSLSREASASIDVGLPHALTGQLCLTISNIFQQQLNLL
jgi:hypothetical protein